MHGYLALREEDQTLPDTFAAIERAGLARIFSKLPAHFYHTLRQFLSFHSADVLSTRSPLECRWNLDTSKTPTQMMIEGSAGHSFLLEGHLGECGIIPDGTDGRTKEGKAILTQLKEEFGPYLIKEEWARDLEEIKAVYEAHSSVKSWVLPNITHTENSIFWQDQATKLWRKSRPDAYCSEKLILVDLKFTTAFSRGELQRTILNFGYHRQLAYYREALAAVGMPVEHCVLVFIKRTRPFDIGVIRIEDAMIEAGHKQNRTNLEIFAGCLESGNWPGAYPSVMEIGLPQWATANGEENAI